MHRLIVILALLLLPVLAGCAGVANPLTGTTAGGGVIARESRLLGTPLPLGMDFYPEHSRISGQEGMEILRGDASPAMCASTICNALQGQGWTARLAYAATKRACYVFENSGRIAAITIEPQAGFTLMIIYVSSSQPSSIPLPVTPRSSFDFGFGSNSGSSSGPSTSGSWGSSGTGSYDVSPGAGSMSTAPESSTPQNGSYGHIQERDL